MQHNKILFILIFFLIFTFKGNTQTILEADGPGNTYELINSVLAPGFDACEPPDCAHPEFGRHITEVWDNELNKYVFEFHIHVNEDNDRCINFDRQRNEIKTYDRSPANLIGIEGETVTYKWKFKLPAGFKASSSFTHLHQIKAVGGDEGNPIFCLTARKGNPNKMELNYYESSSAVKLKTVNLSLFENTWVEVTEKIKISNLGGTYSIEIKNIATGGIILSYSNNNIMTIRSSNTFIRPKWGIYRSLNNAQDLRDEIVRFASFSIEEDTITHVERIHNQLENIIIYQNPYSKNIEVAYVLKNYSPVKIEILDLAANLLYKFENFGLQTPGKYVHIVDSNKLIKGVYLIRLTNISISTTSKVKLE